MLPPPLPQRRRFLRNRSLPLRHLAAVVCAASRNVLQPALGWVNEKTLRITEATSRTRGWGCTSSACPRQLWFAARAKALHYPRMSIGLTGRYDWRSNLASLAPPLATLCSS